MTLPLGERVAIACVAALALTAAAGCGDDVLSSLDPLSQCRFVDVPSSEREVDLLLITDRSESMAEVWWSVIRAVEETGNSVSSSVRVGLAVFPPPFQEQCINGIVVVEPGPSSTAAVVEEINTERLRPTAGPTPVEETLRGLTRWAEDRTSSRRLVLALLSDGGDICGDQSGGGAALQAGELLMRHGARTFVIPIGLSSDRWLGRVADSGGTSDFDARSAPLAAKLQEISANERCRMRVDLDIERGDSVVATLDGETVPSDQLHFEGAQEWRLSGAACEAWAAGDAALRVRACPWRGGVQ